MNLLVASVRIAAATLLACVAGYTSALLGLAQCLAPDLAQGSLVRDREGRVIGSRLVAQAFTRPGYFWPRPSAVGYDAAGAGGSNKSPTHPDLARRARSVIEAHRATAVRPLPAELAAASGSGLDPHLTERAARYQADRVARDRGLAQATVDALIRRHAFSPNEVLMPDRLVNVLELNRALDALAAQP